MIYFLFFLFLRFKEDRVYTIFYYYKNILFFIKICLNFEV